MISCRSEQHSLVGHGDYRNSYPGEEFVSLADISKILYIRFYLKAIKLTIIRDRFSNFLLLLFFFISKEFELDRIPCTMGIHITNDMGHHICRRLSLSCVLEHVCPDVSVPPQSPSCVGFDPSGDRRSVRRPVHVQRAASESSPVSRGSTTLILN